MNLLKLRVASIWKDELCAVDSASRSAYGNNLADLDHANFKYTKIYSGGEPELIEGDIFKTIVPLNLSTTLNDNKSFDSRMAGRDRYLPG
jgi:hypothetical protein